MPVLHRAAVGATRMQVDGLSSVGQYFVTSLFEAGDSDEAGRTYELGAAAAHYEPGFLGDVVRIERFAADRSALEAGAFVFDLDIAMPDPKAGAVTVLRFPPVPGAARVHRAAAAVLHEQGRHGLHRPAR